MVRSKDLAFIIHDKCLPDFFKIFRLYSIVARLGSVSVVFAGQTLITPIWAANFEMQSLVATGHWSLFILRCLIG